jgi:hypothetical protein
MPKSEQSATEQIRKLKEMLQQNEVAAKQMRELITQMEIKVKESKEKKRPSD